MTKSTRITLLKREPWKAHNLTLNIISEPSPKLPKMYRVVARVTCGTLARGVVRGGGARVDMIISL